MKFSSRFAACVAYLFFLLLLAAMGSAPVIAADVCDKNPDLPKCNTDPPPDPEPDPDDPCANFSAPDYAFWRESNKGRVPTKTVFVADSATGCEKELLFIDLSDTGFVNRLNLAYSSVGTGDSFFGRIVFTRVNALDLNQGSVWKYDFGISDGQIQPIGDPVMVLENTDPDYQRVRQLDLSADTGSLVWTLSKKIGERLYELSIHTLDLNGCSDLDWPCATFDEGKTLVKYDYQTPSTGWYMQNPVWGPLGDRIYFVASQYQADSDSHYVMAIDVPDDGSAAGPAKEIFGIEDQVPGDPSYR